MIPARSIKFWLTASAAAIFGVGVFVSRALGITSTVSIASPTANETVSGTTVNTKFLVKGTKLVDPGTNMRNVYGQGHLHLWLDQDNPTKLSAIKIATDTYTFSNVDYGDHKLLVELVNNDHSSFNPKVTATVSFKTVVSQAQKSNQILMISTAAFLFVCVALFFVNQTTKGLKKSTSPKKSSRK